MLAMKQLDLINSQATFSNIFIAASLTLIIIIITSVPIVSRISVSFWPSLQEIRHRCHLSPDTMVTFADDTMPSESILSHCRSWIRLI